VKVQSKYFVPKRGFLIQGKEFVLEKGFLIENKDFVAKRRFFNFVMSNRNHMSEW
jgi:hypothetical protein